MKYLIKMEMRAGNVVEIACSSTSEKQLRKDTHIRFADQVKEILSVIELEKALVE